MPIRLLPGTMFSVEEIVGGFRIFDGLAELIMPELEALETALENQDGSVPIPLFHQTYPVTGTANEVELACLFVQTGGFDADVSEKEGQLFITVFEVPETETDES
jgi:hypothetical protein